MIQDALVFNKESSFLTFFKMGVDYEGSSEEQYLSTRKSAAP
jgi:hypothetical protein